MPTELLQVAGPYGPTGRHTGTREDDGHGAVGAAARDGARRDDRWAAKEEGPVGAVRPGRPVHAVDTSGTRPT